MTGSLNTLVPRIRSNIPSLNSLPAEEKSPCCYYSLCGRVFSWKEITLTGLTLASLGGTIASYFANNYYVQLGTGAIIIADGSFGYFYLRKAEQLGSIHKQVSALDEEGNKLRGTADKATTVVRDLESNIEHDDEIDKKLTKDDKDLQVLYHQLTEKFDILQKQHTETEKTNESLKKSNAQLQSQIQQLQIILKNFKTSLAKFNGENNDLKQNLKILDEKTLLLDKEDAHFLNDFSKESSVFTDDVAALAKEIQQATLLSKQIVATLGIQNSALASELKQIHDQTSDFEKIEKKIKDQTQELKNLIEATQKQKIEFENLEKEFSTLNQTMQRERQEIAIEREKVEIVEKKIHEDEEGLSKKNLRFSDDVSKIQELGKRLETAVTGLGNVDKSLSTHLKEGANQ